MNDLSANAAATLYGDAPAAAAGMVPSPQSLEARAADVLYNATTGSSVDPSKMKPLPPQPGEIERLAAASRLMGEGEPLTPEEAASQLYADEDVPFETKVAGGVFDREMAAAIEAGEPERADALAAAQSALVADMKASGTPARDFDAAFEIMGSQPTTLSEAERDQRFDDGMDYVRQTYGSQADAALAGARQLIADLDKVSPGLIDSLERSGAGSDPRMISLAVKEARRRGYFR